MPTSQQSQELAQRFIQALHQLEDQGDAALDGLLGLFADDACLRNPILQREHHERHGRDDIAAFWRQYRASFSDIRSEFSEVTANDHAAGLFWRARGADPSGQPVEYDGVTLLRLSDDGRIADFQGYFDSRDVVVGAARR